MTLPIIETDLDTQATSTALTAVRGRLTKDSPRKVDTALVAVRAARRRRGAPRSARGGAQQRGDAADVRAPADRRGRRRPQAHRPARGRGGADPAGRRRPAAPRRGRPDPARRPDRDQRQGRRARRRRRRRARVVDPDDDELRERFARGVPPAPRSTAASTSTGPATWSGDVSYFGTMMVQLGLADGMVSGAVHTTAHTIRPGPRDRQDGARGLRRLVGVLHVPAATRSSCTATAR